MSGDVPLILLYVLMAQRDKSKTFVPEYCSREGGIFDSFRRFNQCSVRDSNVLPSEQKSESLLLFTCPVIAICCLHKTVSAMNCAWKVGLCPHGTMICSHFSSKRGIIRNLCPLVCNLQVILQGTDIICLEINPKFN